MPELPMILNDIESQNTPNCLNWLALLSAGTPPAITSGETTALEAVLTATEPDPSYKSQISQAQVNLGRPVDAVDIEASRTA